MKNPFFLLQNIFIDLEEFKVDNISFTLSKGDYLCLIGPTGAGKTILLETILGIYPVKKGKIFFKQKDITQLMPEYRNIGIIYQDFALFPHMNVFKNISYGAKSHSNREIFNLAHLLEISHLLDRMPDTLSGGEKQRVAMARALMANPELLLMDEPFSALDYSTKFKLRNLIKKISKQFNMTIIHITHDFDDVWALANKVGIIKNGKLLQFGTLEEIMQKPKNNFVAKFIDTNLLTGKIINNKKDLTLIDCQGITIYSADYGKIGENVKVSVRPENIIIFKNKPVNQSARNVILAKFTDYYIEKNIYHLILKIEKNFLKAYLTKNAFEDMNLKVGDNVYLLIKATNVRIVK